MDQLYTIAEAVLVPAQFRWISIHGVSTEGVKGCTIRLYLFRTLCLTTYLTSCYRQWAIQDSNL